MTDAQREYLVKLCAKHHGGEESPELLEDLHALLGVSHGSEDEITGQQASAYIDQLKLLR